MKTLSIKMPRNYFRYFLENKVLLKGSTISIAEYCVRGSVDELPLRNIQILPFNLDHAKRAGEFASVLFEEKRISQAELKPGAIIPNDSKLFAQSDRDRSISHFVTSDSRSLNIYKMLSKRIKPEFEIIDITIPYDEQFGIIGFD